MNNGIGINQQQMNVSMNNKNVSWSRMITGINVWNNKQEYRWSNVKMNQWMNIIIRMYGNSKSNKSMTIHQIITTSLYLEWRNHQQNNNRMYSNNEQQTHGHTNTIVNNGHQIHNTHTIIATTMSHTMGHWSTHLQNSTQKTVYVSNNVVKL